MSNLVPYQEVMSMAVAVSKSGMFGIKSEAQALTLMLIAQAEGIHPIQAVQMYSIINGMPSLKSTEVQARFQRSGGKVEWVETGDKKAVCKLSHPDGGEYLSEFGEIEAKRMQLIDKDNYKRMPKQMYMARAMTMGVRAIYPSCLNNMYTSDEVQDFNEPMHDVEFVNDIEPITPEPSLKAEKIILQGRLRDLQLTPKEMKGFVEYYGITDDVISIVALNGDAAALESSVREFEAQLTKGEIK